MPSVALALVLAASGTLAGRQEARADLYASTLLAIARSIEGLKREYPQLAGFSASTHLDVDGLRITYGYRTEKPRPTGGWTSAVPSPLDGGVWLHVDFHDAASKAEIHTQPVVPRYRFRDKRVMLLLREGASTKPLEGALARILLDHGVQPDEDR
jgi:hypothetical protein